MKKQYTTPEVEIHKVNFPEIICTSASFGDGETTIMHARRRDFIFDEEDDLWDE